MPELPDVESFGRYAKRYVLDSRIVDTYVSRDVASTAPQNVRDVVGGVFTDVERYGKHLFFVSDRGAVRMHFGMTGYLEFHSESASVEHERAFVDVERGRLSFVCQRMLGEVGFEESVRSFVDRESLGPDALGMSEDAFVEAFSKRRGALKSALMDQSFLAGIGNVYSDEILFQAGFDPQRHLEREDEIRRLWRVMRRVLDVTIRHDATVSRYPRTYLTRHREDGASCPKCDGTIRRRVFQGRGCYACDTHQT